MSPGTVNCLCSITAVRALELKDYPEKQMIEIEGIKYSYAVFKGLGIMLPLNTPFEIIERKDGVITVNRIKKEKP